MPASRMRKAMKATSRRGHELRSGMILSKLPFSGLLISIVLLIQPALSNADLIYNSQPQPYGGEALGYGEAYGTFNESSGLFYNPTMKPQPDGLSLDLSLRSVGIVRRGQSELSAPFGQSPPLSPSGAFWATTRLSLQ